MEIEKIQKIEQSIENLKNKSSRIYFLVQDTKGNPRASVTQTYEMAYSLKQQGYNTIIIGIAVVFPLLTIWAVNTLFSLTIPYTLETWSAVVLLQIFFKTSISYKKDK